MLARCLPFLQADADVHGFSSVLGHLEGRLEYLTWQLLELGFGDPVTLRPRQYHIALAYLTG
jgi:hypothetical protein